MTAPLETHDSATRQAHGRHSEPQRFPQPLLSVLVDGLVAEAPNRHQHQHRGGDRDEGDDQRPVQSQRRQRAPATTSGPSAQPTPPPTEKTLMSAVTRALEACLAQRAPSGW